MPEAPALDIGGFRIGADHPPVFWPDIDVYFRRNETEALRLIDAVASAGGGFLKGAVLHRADIALPGHQTSYFDHLEGRHQTRDYRDIMEEMVVPLPRLSRILDQGRRAGLKLALSIYDLEGLEFARTENAAALKIPSSNITHKSLIHAAAAAGLPLVLDTGRSRWEEIARAVEWAREAGAGERLLLQHSPPGPPASAGAFHMRMIKGLANGFSVPVGLSDHHPGLDMIPIAVTLGASVIEKGLVTSSQEAGIDRAHALPVTELPLAIGLMRTAFEALGEERRPDRDVPPATKDRMGCIAARSLGPGHLVTRGDIAFAFPADGIGAEHVDALIGCRLTHDLSAGSPFPSSLLKPE